MFDFLKTKKAGETITFNIDGMHCTSCAMNIDGELEDTEGVISAETSYAKAKTVVHYDPTKVEPQQLKEVIESLEYSAKESA